jgi:hypothetical protein
VKTVHRYRTIEIQVGQHVITAAADPLTDGLRQALPGRRCALIWPKSGLNDAQNVGKGLGVAVIVIIWIVVDFFLGLGYGIYRLATRPR